MRKKSKKFDPSKYEAEINSMRRLFAQIADLRKWLLNASLASLAFAITVIFQIKGGKELPHPTLAGFAIGTLIAATVGGLIMRVWHELENAAIDAKRATTLFHAIREQITNAPEMSGNEKLNMEYHIDYVLAKSKELERTQNEPSPYVEIWMIGIEFILLMAGLTFLCIYVWRFLFFAPV